MRTAFLLAAAASLTGGAAATAQPGSGVTEVWAEAHDREFDFWVGGWDVLLRVQQDDGAWVEGKHARAKIYRILDGKAVLELWDENVEGDGIRGFSLRHYDPDAGKWILYLNWPGQNRSGTSTLTGSFHHGRGEFFSEWESEEGGKSISRYTFSDITPTSLRWDDAVSSDGGKTWANGGWIMEFTRTADRADWPEEGQHAHTFYTGERCDLPEFREFERLAGHWEGEVQRPGAEPAAASLAAYRVLDGCAVISFFEYAVDGGTFRELGFQSFNTYAGLLEDARLDNRPGTALRQYWGAPEGDELVLASRPTDETRHRYHWRFDGPDRVQLDIETLDGEVGATVLSASLARVPAAEASAP